MTKADQVVLAEAQQRAASCANGMLWLRVKVDEATRQWLTEGLVAILLSPITKGCDRDAKAELYTKVNMVRIQSDLPYLNRADFEVPV